MKIVCNNILLFVDMLIISRIKCINTGLFQSIKFLFINIFFKQNFVFSHILHIFEQYARRWHYSVSQFQFPARKSCIIISGYPDDWDHRDFLEFQ